MRFPAACYDWLTGEPRRLGYPRLGKADKGLVWRYLECATGPPSRERGCAIITSHGSRRTESLRQPYRRSE